MPHFGFEFHLRRPERIPARDADVDLVYAALVGRARGSPERPSQMAEVIVAIVRLHRYLRMPVRMDIFDFLDDAPVAIRRHDSLTTGWRIYPIQTNAFCVLSLYQRHSSLLSVVHSAQDQIMES